MSYNIEITALFKKQLKRLAKKFPSLKKEYTLLISLLKENSKQGTHQLLHRALRHACSCFSID
jgi:mRNA-degrading endonuclease RelE of RelBE toxin-antitoxin system